MNEHPDNEDSQADTPEPDSLSLWQMVTSALAAAFGVQSSHNRNRDFARGKPGQFIVVGIVLTVVFVIAIVAVVNIVLGSVASP